MKLNKYPFFRLTGSPFDRGFQYGSKCNNLIKDSIKNYSNMFEKFSNMSWDSARVKALNYLPFIQDYCPEIIEEIKGISKGAELDFEDILTLNSRSEIVLDQNSVDGCTAFGITPRIDQKGKSWVCQNWDWIRSQSNNLVILQIDQNPSPSILMVAEAGIISGKGINSSGMGVCFNALSTGSAKQGVPVHFLLRKILDSPTLGDAVETIALAKRASSGNFLTGTSEGEIINIESTPSDFGVLYADDGFLCHTNHFLSLNLMINEHDHGKSVLPDTFHRLGRINSLIKHNRNNLTFDIYKKFLSDHRNYPDSICRHEDPRDPQGKQLASVYSIIMDLKEKKIWISSKNPCESDFIQYEFI